MGTPGRAFALRRMGETRRRNRNAVARGGKAKIGGKTVSAATYSKRTGMTKTKAKAARKRSPKAGPHKGRFSQYSTAQLRKMSATGKKKRASARRKKSKR